MTGYTGKLLKVDLDRGEIHEEPLKEDYAKRFIGGSGLGGRYLFDFVRDKTGLPWAITDPLIFMTGPLTGANVPCCGRFTVCARSPLTGLWGEANSGGDFGPKLKFTGFDGIIITGKASQPVYIEIINGQARLKDASKIWGLDCYQTQEKIRSENGFEKVSIACIGIAGEKQSKMAAIVNDHGRAAARTGLGAVMGGKKLKAVVVQGKNHPKPADEKAFKKAAGEAYSFLKEDIIAEMFRLGGTAFYMDIGMLYGDVPTRYFTKGEFDVSKITGATLTETILTGTAACYRCPIACGRKTKLEKYGVKEADGPEYETLSSLGTLLLIDDLPAIAYAGHLCNIYGLDTISVGATIAFAFYLFEKGVLNLHDTDGMELKWGDVDSVIRLIEKIGHRDGFGDILAEGSLALAKHYGVEEMAVHVKGLEVAMHDPRAFSGMAVAYATSPRGGCHLNSDFYFLEMGSEFPKVEVKASPREQWSESSRDKAQTVARHQDWRSIYDALVMCKFSNISADNIAELISAATGWEMKPNDLMKIGERIFNIKRLINLNFGLTPQDDRLPSLLLKPLPDGGAKDYVPDLNLMIEEYYAFRGWNRKNGRLLKSKLKELGLDKDIKK
jgi:aldehyde:ferredoxin oxidoreductase